MQNKKQFGEELKIKILQKHSLADIAKWAYSVYLQYNDLEEIKFLNLLLELDAIERGSEFSFTYEELEKIADDLMSDQHK